MFDKKQGRTERVSFRLSKGELEELDKAAEAKNEKRSDFIRLAVLEKIKNK